jgi:regulator of replication initiation timing
VEHDLRQVFEAVLLSLIGGLLTFAVGFLRTIAKSIGELNEKVAILIERSNTHKNEIEKLHQRLSRLEESKG